MADDAKFVRHAFSSATEWDLIESSKESSKQKYPQSFDLIPAGELNPKTSN